MMRVRIAIAVFGMCVCATCLAQENPITNGGFEALDAQGLPVDWSILGDARITEDAHSGKHAMMLERSSEEGICGLNRMWEPDSGEQGTMLSELKGGVRFWYKAEAASGPNTLVMYVIPMSEDPFENTGEQRAVFQVPEAHVGDGEWHEGVLKYDFSGSEEVKWVHISPRLRGKSAKLLLDDIRWVERVGPLPGFAKVTLEEVEGKEGEECIIKARVKNAGDERIELGIASIKLAPGLSPEGGPLRNVQALEPDATADVYWRVFGRREEKGLVELSLRAGDREVTASISYEPQLEILGLIAQEFIISPDKTARVSLRLRNSGHAMVRGVSADLKPGVPLSTPIESRKQRLDLIRPQGEASFTWEFIASAQTPSARLRATVDAVNANGGRATTDVIVGAPMPAAGVDFTDRCASIENKRVRLVFPKAEFGYGIGILQRRVEGSWQTVGKLPRLSRLAVWVSEAKFAEHTVYASEARQVDSPVAVAPQMLPQTLELAAKLTDACGANWTITETIVLEPNEDVFSITIQAVPDRDAAVLALEGPMVYAGEGAPEGTRRLDAIFPGLEWLAEGEESSSTLDIAEDHAHRIRYVPHPHMVTIPVMSVRIQPPDTQGTTVSLMWDHLRPYYGELNRPSAVFASPDRFEGRASSVMGLFAPSMPEYIEPNERIAHAAMEVAAGEEVRLEARLAVLPCGSGDTSLNAVKVWFNENGVPDPNALPHGKNLVEEIEFSMAAYLGALWEEEDEAWWGSIHGPAIWHKTGRPPAYLYDMRMCLETSENEAAKAPVRERYDRVIELSGLTPRAEDAGFHFAGPVEGLLGQAGQAAATMRRQREDGSWRFRARIETAGVFKGKDYSELGPDNAAEVGTCARNAWNLLAFARMTGDKEAREAGLKGLAFMDRFEIPRAAQVWEVPVHTPDILASSDACEAYLEGYKITGEEKYLEQAVYWAWTGLPFLYMWDVEGFEFLKYGSIPVFGATWFEGSWFGRPVQWNGLRHAYALFQLAEYDDSLDWAKIARGVTISAMYQQSEDEEDRALWPDAISAIDKGKSGWIFSPRAILKNVYKMMGMQPTPVTVTAQAGFDRFYINAAGEITDAAFEDSKLSFMVTYTAPQTGYVVVCKTSRPSEVMVNGGAVEEVDLPAAGDAPCWRFVPDLNIVEVRLEGSGAHEVELAGVGYVEMSFQPRLAKEIAFEFETGTEGWRPTHDLGAFSAENGILLTKMTGGDPYMVRGNCEVAAETVTQIRIRMALEEGLAAAGQFFWTTADHPGLDEAKSQRFEVIADGEFHEVIVPLGEHELWKGTVTAIRIDPTGGEKQGWLRIDWVRGE